MIEVRRAEADGDLEAWRQVSIAVLPNERCPSVEELRRRDEPETHRLLAVLDGVPVGAAVALRSDLAGRSVVLVRVVASARRRGVGTALLLPLAERVRSLGYDEVGSNVEEPDALGFAERFGFREVDRQVEQVRVVGGEPRPEPPDGVAIVAVAGRPELWRAAYDPLARQAFSDFALDTRIDVTLERWERDWLAWPEGMFLALADGEVIGCAGLEPDADREDRAENALTAVRRDWRGRGIASVLKRTALAFAAEHGIHEVVTWTQQGNAGMRALNERLGYVERGISISVRAPLPLEPR